MSITKKFAVAGLAVAVFGMSALAQDAAPAPAPAPAPAEAAVEPEAAPVEAAAVEEVAAPEPVAQAYEPEPEAEAEEEAYAEPAPAAVVEAPKPTSKVQITPYGAVQYRLRFQLNSYDNTVADGSATGKDESPSAWDYKNVYSWRLGLKAKWDEQLSLQFQIGNDWGAAEAIDWTSNNNPGSRATFQNLYVHLASAKWDPGFMFLEAGVVPLNSNGTLDLMYQSIIAGSYAAAGFNGWSDVNNSMIGIKLGAPLVKGDFKVGVEVFQSVLADRSVSIGSSTTEKSLEDKNQPDCFVTVLQIPVDVGAFKLTPEATVLWNRDIREGKDANGKSLAGSDHEMIFGANASYKVSSDISINLNGGYGMISNSGTKTTSELDASRTGFLVGLGSSIKAGPGTIQLAVNHANNTVEQDTLSVTNVKGTKETVDNYTYGDIRYGVKVHEKVTLTPRYRIYYRGLPESKALPRTNSRLDHRIEAIFDAAF